jgi:hypothetical protein
MVQNLYCAPEQLVAVKVMLVPGACGDAVGVDTVAAEQGAVLSVYVPSQ